MVDKAEIEKWKEEHGINRLLSDKAIERKANPERVRDRSDEKIADLIIDMLEPKKKVGG